MEGDDSSGNGEERGGCYAFPRILLELNGRFFISLDPFERKSLYDTGSVSFPH